MRSAPWHILTLALLVGICDFHGHAFDLFHDDQAYAATGASLQEPSTKPKRSHTSPIRLAPTRFGLTTIQNLRTASAPGWTRLVLDLDSTAHPNRHPQLRAEGLTIEIPNTTLSRSAKAKLAAGEVPKHFVITQNSERSVEVSLPTGSFQSYKMFTLASPNRLVIDV